MQSIPNSGTDRLQRHEQTAPRRQGLFSTTALIPAIAAVACDAGQKGAASLLHSTALFPAAIVLTAASLLVMPDIALAQTSGGRGGNNLGSGGASSETGAGGGGAGNANSGGGGGAGVTGGSGGNGGGAGGASSGANGSAGVAAGSGGGGGAHGYFGATVLGSAAIGGSGGAGAVSDAGANRGGGGGGAGGFGAVVTGTGNLGTLNVNVAGGTGGLGGNGGAGSFGGYGGSGGVGLALTGNAANLTINSSATGGNGGSGGAIGSAGGGAAGVAGNGGVGLHVLGANSIVTIGSSGSVTGGNSGPAVNGAGQSNGGDGITGSNLTLVVGGSVSAGTGVFGRANAVSFTGGTNVLEILSGATFLGNVVASSAADTLRLGGTANGTFDASLIGSSAQFRSFGVYEKIGTSTWTLTGSTSAATPWAINGGTLSISSDGALGASGPISFNGGTLVTTAGFTSARNITLNAGGGTISPATATSLTLSGIIGSTGALTKSGAGTLILSGANTYSGGTTVAEGTLVAAHNAALGTAAGGTSVANFATLAVQGGLTGLGEAITLRSVGVSSGGALRNLSGDNVLTGLITLASVSRINSDAGTLNLAGGISAVDTSVIVGGAGNVTFSGSVSLAAGQILKTGSGTLTFGSGLNLTGTTGGLILSQGTLSLQGNLGAGFGTILTTGSVIDFAQGINNAARVDLNSNTTQFQVTTGTATQSGIISEIGGARPIEKIGAGSLILSGVNSYSGGTVISGGTLRIGADANLGAASGGITINNNANLTFTSALTTNRAITLSGTANIDSSSDITLAGVIGGTGTLTKFLGGTLTLTNTNNYSGGTTVNGGTLQIGNGGTTGTLGSGTVTLNGANLVFNRSDDITVANDVTSTGTVIKRGGGTVTLTGGKSYSNTTVEAGTLALRGTSVLSGGGQLQMLGGTLDMGVDGAISSAIHNSGTLALGGKTLSVITGNYALQSGSITGGGVIALLGNSRNFNVGSTTASIAADVTIRSVGINNAVFITSPGGDYTLASNLDGSGASGAAGSLSVLINNLGFTTTLSGNNNYRLGTTVNSGTLAVGSDTALGTGTLFLNPNTVLTSVGLRSIANPINLVAGSIAIRNTDTSNTFTLGGVITGSSGFDKTGAGTLILTGANTYQGGTTISAGTLQLGSGNLGGSLGSGAVSIASGASLRFDGSGSSAVTGEISGTGSLIVAGTGTATLSSATSNYTGGTTVNSGALALAAASSAGTGTIRMNGGALQANSSFTLTNRLTVPQGADVRIVTAPGVTLTKTGDGTNPLDLVGTLRIATTGTGANAGTFRFSSAATTTGSAQLIVESGTLLNTTSVVLPGILNVIERTQIDAAGTLNLGGINFSGTDGIKNLLGSGTLINNGATTTIKGGSFSGNVSGTQNIISTGTLTLSGASSFTGDATVSSGTLTVTNSQGLGTAAGATTIADGATVALSSDLTLIGENFTVSGSGVGGNGALRSLLGFTATTGTVTLAADALITSDSAGLNLGNVAGGGNVLRLGGFGRIAINGAISNLGELITGSQVTLFGTNTFTGRTTVNGGILDLTGGSSLSDTAQLFVNGAFARFSSSETIGSLAGSGTVQIATGSPAPPNITLTTGGDNTSTTFTGRIQGAGSLIKTGTGTFTLTDTALYSGTTTINGGVLQLGNGGTSGALGIGAVTNNAALVFNRSNNITVNNAISGTGFLTKLGTGVLTLSGASSYAGLTTVSAGTLTVASATALGSSTGGTVVNDGATLELQGGITVTGEALTINGTGVSGGGALRNVSGTNGWTGLITLGSDATIIAADGRLNISTMDIGARNLTTGGAGVVAITSATGTGSLTVNGGSTGLFGTSSFAAGVTVNSGALFAQSGTAINDLAAVVINGGGLVVGVSETIGSLAATGGTVQLNAGQTLTMGGNGTSTSFAGLTFGDGNLTKQGAGTFMVTGTLAHVGSTTISGGTLQFGNGGTVGFIDRGSIINNAALTFNRSDDITISVPISGSGSVTKLGAGVLTLSGASSYSGGTTVSAGTLALNHAAAGTIDSAGTGTILLGNGTVLQANVGGTLTNNIEIASGNSVTIGATAGTAVQLQPGTFRALGGLGTTLTFGSDTLVGDVTLSTGLFTTAGGGRLAIAGGTLKLASNTADDFLIGLNGGTRVGTTGTSATLDLNGFSATVINLVGTAAGTITNTSVTPVLLTLANSNSTQYDGLISGAALRIAKTGTGTLTLTGNNTYGGTSTISAGVLQIGSGSTSGTLGSGDVINNAQLVFNRSDDLSVANAISGSGTLTKLGGGRLTLSGPSSYAGQTTVSAGKLTVANATALGSNAGGTVVDNATTLELQGGITVTGEGLTISGTGVSGGGALHNVSGNNRWTGLIFLSSDASIIGADGRLDIDAIDIGTRNLTTGGAGVVAITSATGTGSLTVNGGSTGLFGTSSFAAGVTVNSGALFAQSGTAINDLAAVVINGGGLVVGVSETIGSLAATGGTVQLNAGQTLTMGGNGTPTSFAALTFGDGNLTKQGAGTFTITGTLAHVGTTTISGGTLQFGNGGTLGVIDRGSIVNNAALTFNRSDEITIGVPISGTGTLTKLGAGTLTLTGANTLAGAVTISAGTLQIGNGGTAGALGTGAITNNGTLAINLSSDITLVQLITGTGALRKLGGGVATLSSNLSLASATVEAGTLLLSGSNSFTTGITVAGGTLALRSANAAGGAAGIVRTTGSVIDYSDGLIMVTPIQLNSNTTQLQVLTGSATQSGVISETGGARPLEKIGAGTLTLSGVNSYSGGTTITAGRLNVASSANLGNGAGGLTIGNAVLGVTATFSSGRTVSLTGAAGIDVASGASLIQSGLVSGLGGLTKTGPGTLFLTANNSYAGTTTVSGGDVIVGGGSTAGTLGAGNVVVNNGSALQFNRSDVFTVANTISGGGLVAKQGNGVMTLTGANTFSSALAIAGGTVVLDHATGGVIDAAGTGLIQLLDNTILRSAVSGTLSNSLSVRNANVTVAAATGTTLRLASSQLSFDGPAGSPLNFGTATATGTVELAPALVSLGAAVNPININGGTLRLNNAAAFTLLNGSNGITLNGATLGVDVVGTLTKPVTISAAGGTVDVASTSLEFSGANTFNGALTKTGTGDLRLSAATTGSGIVQLNTGMISLLTNTASFGTGTLQMATGTTLRLPTVSGRTLANDIVLGADAGSGIIAPSLILSGALSGGRLNVVGGGPLAGSTTLILTGANTYGSTSIAAGNTLQIGNSGLTGTLGIGAVQVSGTLAFNRSDLVQQAALITGAGIINQNGAGTLNLGFTNSNGSDFTGTINVNAGTLLVGGSIGDTTARTAQINVASGATLGGSSTFNGNVSVNSGGILSPGSSAGTLTIAGNLTLGAASLLNFELGEPGVVGGASSDLVNVGGNLVLDGTLNVTALSGFGAGFYRLFNYGGTLTNNQLVAGILPGGFTSSISTDVAGQVNVLFNAGAQTVQYWDGADVTGASAAINGDGGAGIWDSTTTNWTNPAAFVFNNAWAGQAGVFAGTAGGNVQVSGAQAFQDLQFQTDGYNLTATGGGGSLATTGAFSMLGVSTGLVATIGLPITGTAGLTKTGAGTLRLTGANTFDGLTTVASGTLNIASATALGSGAAGTVVAGGAVLEIEGGIGVNGEALTINGTGVSGAGALRNVSGTNSWNGTVTLGSDASIIAAAGRLDITNLAGTGQNLTTGGAGVVALTNTTTAGSLTVTGGSTGLFGTGNFLGGVTVTSGALFLQSGSAINDAAAVTVNGGGVIVAVTENIGSLAGTGGTIQLDSTRALAVGGNNAATSYAGQFFGGGSLIKQGTGTLTLTLGLDQTGGTFVNGGTLLLGTANVMRGAGSATVNAGGTLDLGGFAQSVPSLTMAGGTLTNGTLTGAIASTGGTIANSTGSSNSLTTSAGTTTLTGNGQFGLGVTLNGGTLVLQGSGASISDTAAVTVSAGTLTVGVSETIGSLAGTGGTVQIAAGQVLTTGGNGAMTSYAGVIGGNGAFTKTGTGVLTLGGVNTYSGITTVNGGTISVGAGGAIAGAVQNNATFINTGAVAGLVTNAGALTSTGALTGGLTNSAGATASIAGQVNGAVSNGGTITLTGITTGIGALTQASGGTFNLAGFNTTTGSLSGAGAVQLGNGSLTTGGDNASTSFGGVISGTGGLTKTGTGTLTLSGANSFTGATSIAAGGQIELADSGTLAGAIMVNTGAALRLNRTSDLALGGVITGGGAIEKLGAGTVTLTGSNSAADNFTGQVNVTSGTLVLNGILGDSIGNAAQLTLANGTTLTGNGSFLGNVALGAGTIVAPGNSPGTLAIGGNLLLDATSVLNFELAQPGVVGGGINDLITVGGNLSLDGTLNITSLPGFGAGIYRLLNYGGTLTDNGLALGTLPGGFTSSLVTSVAGQISIQFAMGMLTILYWDGSDITAASNAVNGNGGSGTWSSLGNNWTAAPSFNSNFAWGGQTGVFAGATGGNVSIEGTQAFQQLRFETGGYTLNSAAGGGGLATTGGLSIIDVSSGLGATINAPIMGNAGLTKAGAGTLTLGGVNSYSGVTSIAAGTLALGSGGTIAGAVENSATFTNAGTVGGQVTNSGILTSTGALNGGLVNNAGFSASVSGQLTGAVSNAGTLNIIGQMTGNATLTQSAGGNLNLLPLANATIGSLAGAGSVHLGTGTLTVGTANASTSFGGIISGSGGLTKSGSGTLTLSGSNSYTGVTRINRGALAITSTGSLAGSVVNNAVLTSTGTLNGLLSNETGAVANIEGVLRGAVINRGTITLTGGTTGIGDVVMSAGSTFNLAGFTTSFGSLAGGGGTVALGSATLTIGSANLSQTYDGTITGNGGLIKTGTGTTSFSGAQGFTGLTTVNGGTLILGSNASLAGAVANNALLASTGRIAGLVTNTAVLNSVGALDGGLVNAAGATATIGGTLAGAVSNSGSITLTSATSGIGAVTQAGTGSFVLGPISTSFGSLAGSGIVRLAGGAVLTTGSNNASTGFDGVITGAGGVTKTGTGAFTLNGANDFTGLTTVSGGTLVIGGGGSLGSAVVNTATFINSGTVAGAVTNAGTLVSTGTLSGALSNGAGALVQLSGQVNNNVSNAGTLVLTGGTTGIVALSQAETGSLDLGGNTTSVGSLSGTGVVQLGSAVLTTGADNASTIFAGVIAGSGGLTKLGAGTFTLTGANTYAGPTTVAAGVLNVQNNMGLGTGAGGTVVNAGAALELQGGIVVTGQALAINGSGIVNGGALRSISGNSAWTGTVSLGSDARIVTVAGRLDIDRLVGTTQNLTIAGSGITGIAAATTAGTLTVAEGSTALFGSGDFAAGVNVIDGNLFLQGASSINDAAVVTLGTGNLIIGVSETIGALAGGGAVQIDAGQSLTFGGNNTSTSYDGVIFNTGNLVKAGAGTFTVKGTLAHSGTTSINGGTLLSGAANVWQGNGPVTISTGGTLDLGGVGQSIAAVALAGGTLTNGMLAGAITSNGGTINGITDAANSLVTSAGTTVLTGAGGFALGVTLNGGVLSLQGDGASIDDAAAVTVNAGTLVLGASETIGSLAGIGGNVQLGNMTLVTGGNNASTIYRGLLSGLGGLVKTGFGTFTLTGINSYTGTTVVDAGTLIIGDGTIGGQLFNAAGATATNNGVIAGAVFNEGQFTSTHTLSGGLSNLGTAGIRGTVTGDVFNAGTITLTGSTTGIARFEQAATGRLDLNGFGTTFGVLSGAGTIVLGDARLTTGTNGVATRFGGVISGTGGLTKTATGSLILTGENQYSGATTIAAGMLQLGDGGSIGSILGPITNNGTLIINRSNGYTLGNVISGTGLVVQGGTGTTTLAGANTYSGGTLISAGRLVGSTLSLQGLIQNDAALEFAQATNGVFAGRIGGSGVFDKTGVGLLELALDNSALRGATTVRGGELRVTGSLAGSATTVLSGATLSGTGTLGGLTARSGSVVSPGNGAAGTAGLGMLGVNGAIQLQQGSTLRLQVQAVTGSDMLVGNAAAQIAGTAAITNLGGTYAFNSNYLLLQASGGRTGTFESVTGLADFGILYRPELVYTANQVLLRMAPNRLSTIVGTARLTANQRAVVSRIDAAVAAGYNPQPLFNVYNLSASLLPGAFDQLSGEIYATAAGVGIEQERLVREAVLGRMGAVASASRATPELGTGAGAWAQLFGSWGDGNGDGNASRFENDRQGFITGIDFGSANSEGSWRIGAFGLNMTSKVSVDRLGSRAEVEQTGGGIYAGINSGGFSVATGVAVTGVDLTSVRGINLPGFAETNRGRGDGKALQGFAELSYRIEAGKATYRPFVSAAAGSFKLDALTETGGAAALAVRRQSYASGSITAGIDGTIRMDRLMLSGILAGRAQIGDRDPQALVALAATPTQAFGIRGVQLDSFALAARLDATVRLGRNADLSVGYTGLIGEDSKDHGARATLSVRF